MFSRQKIGQRDSGLLLNLLMERRLPQVWAPSLLEPYIWQLQQKQWTEKVRTLLEQVPFSGWTLRRREDDLKLHVAHSYLNCEAAETPSGVEPITALAFVPTLGTIRAFLPLSSASDLGCH